MSDKSKAIKVAILGGGMAAMTAAFELTDPSLHGKYEVTVYQLGWRLGGKGASGRDINNHDRILEHGLHVWLGCYENSFHIMRAHATPSWAARPMIHWEPSSRPLNRRAWLRCRNCSTASGFPGNLISHLQTNFPVIRINFPHCGIIC